MPATAADFPKLLNAIAAKYGPSPATLLVEMAKAWAQAAPVIIDGAEPESLGLLVKLGYAVRYEKAGTKRAKITPPIKEMVRAAVEDAKKNGLPETEACPHEAELIETRKALVQTEEHFQQAISMLLALRVDKTINLPEGTRDDIYKIATAAGIDVDGLEAATAELFAAIAGLSNPSAEA